jgi:CRP/FNR family transcriptional regulator/CRP/FNR family cyclic AMP-dependent transcriptional regulator
MNTVATREQALSRLAAIPMFSELDASSLEALSAMVQYRRYPKGAFVVGQHELGSSMFLLVSGRVKVSLANPEGKELVLSYLEAPAHFGEMASRVRQTSSR